MSMQPEIACLIAFDGADFLVEILTARDIQAHACTSVTSCEPDCGRYGLADRKVVQNTRVAMAFYS